MNHQENVWISVGYNPKAPGTRWNEGKQCGTMC